LITLNHYIKSSQKSLKFMVLLLFFALLLASLIYWREDSVQDQISFLRVLTWQVIIWIPWALAFVIFKIIIDKSRLFKFRILVLYGSGIIWIGMHFAWFYSVSSNFSPYLEMPATRYGVYPYFFIFWTLVDIGLMWFVMERIKQTQEKDYPSEQLMFELSRGDKKYFCEPKKIRWLSADDYYTQLFTDQGRFLVRKPLKHFYEKLPRGDFRRIHRSTIVNVNYVSGLARGKNDRLEVILKDSTRHKVSRNYSKEIREFFRNRSL